MGDFVAYSLFIVAGILLTAYGIRGIATRRITVFAKGRLPQKIEGSGAVSYAIVVTVFGAGFSLLGSVLLFLSSGA